MCPSWSSLCFAGLQPKSLPRASRASCVVLLRHGEREDYMAEKAGRKPWSCCSSRIKVIEFGGLKLHEIDP